MYSEQQQIYWHSGLYLQPQHFQSLDLHYAWLLARQRQLAQPFNTGVAEAVINIDALEDDILSIDRLRFILPGGDYLEYPGNCRIEKRSFHDSWKRRDLPLTFWLVLRRFDPLHPNVTLPEKESDRAGTRWISLGEAPVMKDIYDRSPDTAITRLIYNVQLLTDAEKESAVDCESLPLIRLRHDGERVVCDPAFSPPVIELRGSPALHKLIETLYFELAARAKKLSEFRRAGGADERLTRLLAMRSLNRTLPLLKNFLAARQIHPWQIYNALLQLMGELSSFDEDCSCLGEWRDGTKPAPGYDHYRLYESFSCLRQTLMALIKGLALEDNLYLRLSNDGGIFYGRLERAALAQKGGQLLLLLRSAQIKAGEKKFASTDIFKLASQERIEALIQHALPGIPVTRCIDTPQGVPDRSDAAWYLIGRQSELWRQAEESGTLAFYFPDMPDDLDVQLVATERE